VLGNEYLFYLSVETSWRAAAAVAVFNSYFTCTCIFCALHLASIYSMNSAISNVGKYILFDSDLPVKQCLMPGFLLNAAFCCCDSNFCQRQPLPDSGKGYQNHG
jgi:hypothetical protein